MAELPCIYWLSSAERDKLIKECKVDLDDCCRRYRSQLVSTSEMPKKIEESRVVFISEAVIRKSTSDHK